MSLVLADTPYSAPAAPAFSETYTILNESGSAVSTGQKWMLEHHFKTGDIDPATERVVLKYGGTELTAYQQDMENNHDDGSDSLRSARFWIELPAGISDGSSLDLTVTKEAGSPDNTTSIAYTDVTGGSDLSVEMVVGGTTYYSDLNDLMASATIVEQGPLAVTWRGAEMLHDSNPTDHSDLWALWFITWFDDDSYRVWVGVGNGFINDAGSDITFTRLSLKDGATSLIEETSISKVSQQGSMTAVVDGSGECYWSGGAPKLTNAPDIDYLQSTKIIPRMMDSLAASLSAATVPTMVFTDSDDAVWSSYAKNIDNTGPSAWLGQFPNWSARYFIALHGGVAATIASWEKYSKVQGSAWMSHPHWYYASNFEIPNFISGHASYSGLTAASTVRLHSGDGWGMDGAGLGWAALAEASHGPSPGFLPWLIDGDPWWVEELQLMASHVQGYVSESTRVQTVNSVDYVMHQDSYQERATSWMTNLYLNAMLATPDGHICEDILDEYCTGQLTGLAAKSSETYANGGNIDTQKALGFLFPSGHSGPENNAKMWMQNYGHQVFARAAKLGIAGAADCVTEYVEPFAIGLADAGRDRTDAYAIVYFNSEIYKLDGVKTAYQTWEEMWGGTDAFPSGDNLVGNDCGTLNYSGLSGGPFTVGETIEGLTSGITTRVILDSGSELDILGAKLTAFTLGETIQGQTSGATATFDSRTFYGEPLIPNSAMKTGDPSPTDTPECSDSHYSALWVGIMGALGDYYSSGAAQTNVRGHWDDWWSGYESAFSQAEALNKAQFICKYEGASD